MFSEDLFEIKNSDLFIVDLMYAGFENMTLCPVYERIGFGNRAFVRKEMLKKLEKLTPFLRRQRLKLKICDAYRPPIAHEMLHDIVPIPGFFASSCQRSLHCRGAAIDCCLCYEDGRELIYPTRIDAYEKQYAEQLMSGNEETFTLHLQKARHDYQNPDMPNEIANRKQLKKLMESIGLESIPNEWWHYNLPNGADYPLIVWKKD